MSKSRRVRLFRTRRDGTRYPLRPKTAIVPLDKHGDIVITPVFKKKLKLKPDESMFIGDIDGTIEIV